MHSTSKVTCSASTSATLQATLMMDSGRRAASSGQLTATTVHIPETGPPATGLPLDRSPQTKTDQRHDSSGWGEAPLGVVALTAGAGELPYGLPLPTPAAPASSPPPWSRCHSDR